MVSKEKGEALARSQEVPFLETSAKTNYNIDEAFEKLARHILRKVGSSVHDVLFLDEYLVIVMYKKLPTSGDTLLTLPL